METRNVPLIPLTFVVFPQQSGNLNLSDRDLVSLLHVKYLKGNRYAGVFLKKDDSDQREIVSSVSDVYGVGTLVEILEFQDQDEKWRLHVKGIQRISLKGILPWSSDGCPQSEPQPANYDLDLYSVFSHYRSQKNDQSGFQGEKSTASKSEVILTEQTPNSDEKFMMAQIEILNDESDAKLEELEALCQDIKKIINDIALIFGPEVQVNYLYEFNPRIWAYELASWTPADHHKKQLVLEENKIGKRLRLVSLLLEQLKFQCMGNQHLEVPTLLSEYKITQNECLDIQKNESYPKAVRDAINTVMAERERKYEDYNRCENYLETLISLPWNVLSQENLDMEHAKRSLDADLIGMEVVKKRILGFIQGAQGKTLFIYGPPGAGKKSIGKAIAHALKRKWAMVDLKYMMDVADLLGKTWMCDDGRPGMIVKSLKETGTMNPVILLNGVDMVWRRQENSICCALFNLLHWAMKSSFLDSYLGFKVDLSKVLFVCIASDINSIPYDLHNNLPVIEVTGYFLHEKLEIAKKFLTPAVQLLIDDSTIVKLVLEYCQELGVKHLKRMIESIAVIHRQDEFMTVNKENVESYLQESKRHRVHETTPVGVVRGLAYDHKSSSAFYIEAVALSEGNGNSCTGHLGTTFKESVDVAVSYVKDKIPEINKYWFHIHVPPGAIPKNGTSAGIAIVTAIMSWCLGKPVRENMAMTGEMTLHGTVQPVSGIRQKMIAAEKEGVTCIILPKGNKNDYEKLPEHFKEGRRVFFVDNCKDVFRVVFPELDNFWNSL